MPRLTHLLRAGMPIARVATEAGFYDRAHLTRHFKRIVGLNPGPVRQGRRELTRYAVTPAA